MRRRMRPQRRLRRTRKVEGREERREGGQKVDDSKTDDKKRTRRKKNPWSSKIDIDGIGQRILALPIPPKNYVGLATGKAGTLFVAEGPQVIREQDQEDLNVTLHKLI